MKKIIGKLTPFHWFVIKAIGLYLIWMLFIQGWVLKPQGLNDQTTFVTGKVASWVLNNFGYYSYTIIEGMTSIVLYVNNLAVVSITDACNALVVITLYIGFILAYPGKWQTKIPFIALGTLLVFAANVLRVILLAFNRIYHHQSFDFNHKYTFTFIVYAIVFLLWMTWANSYSSVSMTSTSQNQA